MITLFDWILLLFNAVVIITVIYLFRPFFISKSDNHLFTWALIIKVFGSVLFALIYVYYYGFGDSITYFKGARSLSELFLENPGSFFEMYYLDDYQLDYHQLAIKNKIGFIDTPDEWFMIRITAPLVILSMNSYLVVNFYMAFISLIGSWYLFLLFRKITPYMKTNILFIIVFLLPSIFFWGSGYIKDTITFSLFCVINYIVYVAIEEKQYKLKYIFVFLLSSYIIFELKAYILLAFIPTILILFFHSKVTDLKNKALKLIVVPLTSVVVMVLIFFGVFQLASFSDKYNTQRIENNVKGFHSWHTDVGGSTYDLHVTDYSPVGVLLKAPEAINVTYFRPYPNEVSSVFMVVSSVESMLLLFVFLMVLFKLRLNIFKKLFQSPYLLSASIFCLIFGFAVGFTSYNFGALMRYKIPAMPLVFFILVSLYYSSRPSYKI